jgi:hypothetical protein
MVLGPRVRTTRSLLLLSALFLAAAALTGCEDQLFVADEPRSQYDRFDAVRDRRAELYIEDEFGNRRPNLRGRLLTSE